MVKQKRPSEKFQMAFFPLILSTYHRHHHRYHIKPIVMIYLIAYTTILSVRSIFVEPFYLRTPYCLVALHIL